MARGPTSAEPHMGGWPWHMGMSQTYGARFEWIIIPLSACWCFNLAGFWSTVSIAMSLVVTVDGEYDQDQNIRPYLHYFGSTFSGDIVWYTWMSWRWRRFLAIHVSHAFSMRLKEPHRHRYHAARTPSHEFGQGFYADYYGELGMVILKRCLVFLSDPDQLKWQTLCSAAPFYRQSLLWFPKWGVVLIGTEASGDGEAVEMPTMLTAWSVSRGRSMGPDGSKSDCWSCNRNSPVWPFLLAGVSCCHIPLVVATPW